MARPFWCRNGCTSMNPGGRRRAACPSCDGLTHAGHRPDRGPRGRRWRRSRDGDQAHRNCNCAESGGNGASGEARRVLLGMEEAPGGSKGEVPIGATGCSGTPRLPASRAAVNGSDRQFTQAWRGSTPTVSSSTPGAYQHVQSGAYISRLSKARSWIKAHERRTDSDSPIAGRSSRESVLGARTGRGPALAAESGHTDRGASRSPHSGTEPRD